MNELMASMQAEASAERRAIVELLAELRDAKDQGSAARRKEAPLAERVRAYMALEGLDELTDDERGIRAYFEERRSVTYDLRSMAKSRPELVLWAAEQGLLDGSATRIRTARKGAPSLELDDIERFGMPEITTALKVETK